MVHCQQAVTLPSDNWVQFVLTTVIEANVLTITPHRRIVIAAQQQQQRRHTNQ